MSLFTWNAKEIGQRIHEARLRYNLSLEDMTEIISYTPDEVMMIERGWKDVGLPTLHRVEWAFRDTKMEDTAKFDAPHPQLTNPLYHIEKIMRDQYGVLCVEEERYGPGLLAGFDIKHLSHINNATDDKDATLVYTGTEIADTIEIATSPGDMDALQALDKLEAYSQKCPHFLFVHANNLVDCLFLMEMRAYRWSLLSQKQQEETLLNFVDFIGTP